MKNIRKEKLSLLLRNHVGHDNVQLEGCYSMFAWVRCEGTWKAWREKKWMNLEELSTRKGQNEEKQKEKYSEVMEVGLTGEEWKIKSEGKTGSENLEHLTCHAKNVELFPAGNREPLKGFKPESDLHIGKVTLTGYGGWTVWASGVRDTCWECVVVV